LRNIFFSKIFSSSVVTDKRIGSNKNSRGKKRRAVKDFDIPQYNNPTR
jgi:hypothetical protein